MRWRRGEEGVSVPLGIPKETEKVIGKFLGRDVVEGLLWVRGRPGGALWARAHTKSVLSTNPQRMIHILSQFCSSPTARNA